jgi:hypothetical protein
MTLPLGREIVYKREFSPSWRREKNQYTSWQWSEWKQDIHDVLAWDFVEGEK